MKEACGIMICLLAVMSLVHGYQVTSPVHGHDLLEAMAPLSTLMHTRGLGNLRELGDNTSIKKMIDEILLPGVAAEHEQAQLELNGLMNVIALCGCPEDDNIRQMKTNAEDASQAHVQCRIEKEAKIFEELKTCQTLLTALQHSKTSACGAVEDAKKIPYEEAAACQPSGTEGYELWLENNLKNFEGELATFMSFKDRCTNATAEHEAKAFECSQKQTAYEIARGDCTQLQLEFEGESCTYASAVQTRCLEYKNCYASGLTSYQMQSHFFEAGVEERKVMYRMLMKISCLAEAQENATSADNAEGCEAYLDTPTTALDLVYPYPPTNRTCVDPGPATCSDDFISEHYKNVPDVAPAAECQPCHYAETPTLPLR